MVERHYSSTAVETELSSGVDDSTGSISVDSTTGYPTSYPFTIVLDPDTASEELCDVTNTVGTTHTVTRGVDGTVGLSHESGAVVKHTMSGRDLQDSRDHEEADSDVHGIGASSDVMGTETTQTPINKTLDGDDNTFQNIPQSAVTDLVSEQATQDSDISDNASNISSLTSTVSNHESSSAVHGVGEVAGLTEAQTLTNKSMNGDNNSFSNIDQGSIKRAVLNLEGDGTDRSMDAGTERLRTTFDTLTNVGGFTTGGGPTAERVVPYDGMYLVQQAARVTGSNNNTNEEFTLRIRQGGTSGETDGSIISAMSGNMNTAGTPEGFANLVEIIGPLSAGDRLKFTIHNSTGDTISDDGHPDRKYAGLIYLGPA